MDNEHHSVTRQTAIGALEQAIQLLKSGEYNRAAEYIVLARDTTAFLSRNTAPKNPLKESHKYEDTFSVG